MSLSSDMMLLFVLLSKNSRQLVWACFHFHLFNEHTTVLDFYIDSVFKLALGHCVENRTKTLISVRPCDLNEGENISASCYFNRQPAVVHLSIFLIFSLSFSCSLNCAPPIICGLLCCFLPIRRCYH